MSDRYNQHRGLRTAYRCQFERTLKGEYCGEDGAVTLGGLRLCNHHAAWLRLEERLTYWRAILAHIELWSEVARRRSRGDVECLLEVERARVSAALARATEEAEELADSRHREVGLGSGKALPL